MHTRGGYIYCRSPCMINSRGWACSAAFSVLSALGFESGRIFVWKCRVEGKHSEEQGSSVYWKIYMMTQTIMRRIHNTAKMAPYDLFWMFPLAEQRGGRERERWLQAIGVESKLWRDYYCCPGLSAPPAIARKEKKEGDQKEERFWLKEEKEWREKEQKWRRKWRRERVRGGCDQGCISSLCSGRLNQQCQVFFLVFFMLTTCEWQTGQRGGCALTSLQENM